MTATFTLLGRKGSDLVVGPRHQRVMGIVNLTPDSFSDGGRFPSPDAAVEYALGLEADGAHVLDLGAESSRPGADPICQAEELDRLMPVLERLRPRTRLPISIDTTKAAVARAALEVGADWINDISALQHDPEMAETIARSGAAVVLMHRKGDPKTMQVAPSYDDVVREVTGALSAAARAAAARGIAPDRIVLDPGIGFGKRQQDNLDLLRGLPRLVGLGFPILLGASRKTFLGRLTARSGDPPPPGARDAATVAVLAVAHAAGVSVHRVHNVRYAMDALRTLEGIGRR